MTNKVKIKLRHLDAVLIHDRLEDTIGASIISDKKLNRLFTALFVEVFIKLKSKTITGYAKEKSFTLSYPQAIALEEICLRWYGADIKLGDERAAYRCNLFQSVSSLINKETA